ncbi:MAG TPA: TIGR00725 family protein [Candidatus Obscuribacterales bacterium]
MSRSSSRARKPVIGVMGAGRCGEEASRQAHRVGRLIAERGAVLLCGGMGGVMEAACAGAREAGGLTVGIMPGMNDLDSPPNPHVELAIFTGLSDGRNWVNVCASDALIAIAGGYGTLSEIALALKIGKPVVLLHTWKFQAEEPLPEPATAATAEEAVELAFQAIKRAR